MAEQRLIDASAMREFVLHEMLNEKTYCANDFLDVIDEQPTVDAVPVVHGHWVQCVGEWMPDSIVGKINTCSVCGHAIVTNGIDKTGKALIATVNNPFCRWCGAKMDERIDTQWF